MISDWGATHSAQFINAGLDMEMIDGPDSTGYQEPAFLGAVAAACRRRPIPPARTRATSMAATFPKSLPRRTADSAISASRSSPKTIAEALADGSITEAAVTRAAGHVLYEMDRFGLLDGKPKHDVTAQAIEANARIIEKTGEEAAVLLEE